MCHGTNDQVVRYDWGNQSFEALKNMGAIVDFKTYVGMGHSVDEKEISDILSYIKARLN